MSHVRISAAATGLLWSVALISLVWLVLSAMAIALGYWLDETTLSGLLPAQYEWELMAWELQLSAVVVVILAGPALAAVSWGRGLLSRRPGARAVAIGLLRSFAAVSGAAYCGSWVSFVSTGRFLDGDGVGFMTMSPVQFVHHSFHIDPLLVVALPAMVVGAHSWTGSSPRFRACATDSAGPGSGPERPS